MKVAVLAALSVLIAIPSAEAAQRHLQNGVPATTCDNDGHCATLAATRAAASPRKVRPEIKKTVATARAQPTAVDANGNATAGVIVSSKTGARARVGVAYAARFQAYIDDLENNHGARVLFMGGIRPGHCSPASEHPCGKALDVCQLRRGVVDSRCNLPARRALGEIAAAHGLFEGGRWCNSDYGHAQIGVTAAACGDKIRIVRQ
jgi:D-alanyl-D-alanine carboxypeptidase